MTKTQAIRFLGSVREAAFFLDIGDNAVKQWPDQLGDKLAAHVLVAGIQHKGLDAAMSTFPEMFERATY